MICCLSPICSTILFLFSMEAPLEMKMHPRASMSRPKIGTFLKVFFDANAALKCEISMGTSNQEEWFEIIVEICFGGT